MTNSYYGGAEASGSMLGWALHAMHMYKIFNCAVSFCRNISIDYLTVHLKLPTEVTIKSNQTIQNL